MKRQLFQGSLRRSIQAFILSLFLYLFLKTSYPLTGFLSLDSFLKIDPFIALASLFSLKKYASLLPVIVLVITSLLLGRFFCGWFCPLGSLLDLFNFIFRRNIRVNRIKVWEKLRGWKYVLLYFLLLAWVFSVQLFYFLDPLSLTTRTFTLALFPLALYLGEGILELARLILPLPQYRFIPPPLFQANLANLLIFSALIGISLLSVRFWCRYLCPLGSFLGLLGKLSLVRRKVSEACNQCGSCVTGCPTGAIQTGGRDYRKSECLECLTCLYICPQKAIKFQVEAPKVRESYLLDINRRSLLSALGLGILSVAMVKFSGQQGMGRERLLRPPGALGEEKFLLSCTRCGACMKVCITNGLQPSLLESGLAGLWTPRLIPRRGWCEQFCTLCGQVCPTGAIGEFSEKTKTKRKLGLARINRERCIAWAFGRLCLICNEVCPVKAVIFDRWRRPYVVEEKCWGCGLCEHNCPVVGEAAIAVHSKD